MIVDGLVYVKIIQDFTKVIKLFKPRFEFLNKFNVLSGEMVIEFFFIFEPWSVGTYETLLRFKLFRIVTAKSGSGSGQISIYHFRFDIHGVHHFLFEGLV